MCQVFNQGRVESTRDNRWATDRPSSSSCIGPIPLHYHPSYHRCLLHLLLSFLSRSASTMTRGAIMSTSFQDSFTPSFESYRSSSYLSFLPSISLSLFNEIVLCAVTLFFFFWLSSLSSYSSPVIFLVSLLLFSFFFSFCKSSLSFSPFPFFHIFLFTPLFRYYTHLVAFLTSFCLFPRIMCSLCARTNYDLFYFSSYCLR